MRDKNKYNWDLVLDFETANDEVWRISDVAVVTLSAVCFYSDPNELPDFKTLINTGFSKKFDLKYQIKEMKPPKFYSDSCLQWWATLPEDAKKWIRRNPELDMKYEDVFREFVEWVNSKPLNRESKLWTRGNDFDVPLLNAGLHSIGVVQKDWDNKLPIYNRTRDIRTAIDENLEYGVTYCPLRKGILDGFVKHDSLHDCAKDAIELTQSRRYVRGLDSVPSREELDPVSINTQ